MEKQDIEFIKNDTNGIRVKNVEEFFKMFKNFIDCYIPTMIKMGITHNLTKQTLKIFKEFYLILREEDRICLEMQKNSKNLDFFDAMDILNTLDLLNEQTYEYYENLFGGIEDAVSTGDMYRATRSRKNFSTLIESDEIQSRVKQKRIELTN